MADIFISYANEDREVAGQIATVLGTAGFTVWWDRRIPAGRSWRSVLEEALQGMRCLVILWSEHSIRSPWVIEEAEEARRLNKIMFPVMLEKIDPPVGFRAIQAASLVDWDGAADAPAAQLLVTDLKSLLGTAQAPSRGDAVNGRVNNSGPDDSSVPDQLRRKIAHYWKTLVGGIAAIALLIVVLQISWPGPKDGDSRPADPVNEPAQLPPPVRRLTGITIAGSPAELKPADTAALKLRGNYSDGTIEEIADSVKWTSSDSRVARVDSQGKLNALHPGTAEVSARFGDLVSAPLTIAVTSEQKAGNNPPAVKMVQLAISAVRKELSVNESVALRVLGRYSDKSEKPVARELQWQISNPAVAAITPEGRLSGLRAGKVDVSVRAGELVSAPILVVVKDLPQKAQIETLAVKPRTDSKVISNDAPDAVRPRLAPLIARAKNLREQGQYGAALAELQKAAAIDPTNGEVTREIDQTTRACAAERSLGQKIDC